MNDKNTVILDGILLNGPIQTLSEKEVPEIILENTFFNSKPKKRNFLKIGPTGFQEADSISKNNRLYPSRVLESAVAEVLPIVKSFQCIGELDHMTVDKSPFPKLAFSSHLVTELSFDTSSKKVIGSAIVLHTPYGKVLRELIESGVNTGVSVRGLGDLEVVRESRGEYNRVKKFRIITYEFVSWAGFNNLIINKNLSKTVQTISESLDSCPTEIQGEIIDDLLLRLNKDFKSIPEMQKMIAISKIINHR